MLNQRDVFPAPHSGAQDARRRPEVLDGNNRRLWRRQLVGEHVHVLAPVRSICEMTWRRSRPFPWRWCTAGFLCMCVWLGIV